MEKFRSQFPEKDWVEDFEHENGNYQCPCLTCGNTFFGHKRRLTCKVCAEAVEEINAGDMVDTKPKDVSGFHPLRFLVDEIQVLHGVRMACGRYGCISCELLVKVE